jgi:hypothetical protein
MSEMCVLIRMGAGDAAQRAAWDKLWRLLLSPGEPSNDGAAKQSPDPVDKTKAGPNEAARVSAPGRGLYKNGSTT